MNEASRDFRNASTCRTRTVTNGQPPLVLDGALRRHLQALIDSGVLPGITSDITRRAIGGQSLNCKDRYAFDRYVLAKYPLPRGDQPASH